MFSGCVGKVYSVWCLLSGLRPNEFLSRLPSDLHLKGLLPLVEPPDHNRRGVSVQSTVANIMGHRPFLEKFRTYRLKRAGLAFVLRGLE